MLVREVVFGLGEILKAIITEVQLLFRTVHVRHYYTLCFVRVSCGVACFDKQFQLSAIHANMHLLLKLSLLSLMQLLLQLLYY